MRAFFQRQIDEIAGDPALRTFGVFLSLGHGLGALWWLSVGHHGPLGSADQALCWPFFETCFEYRFLDPSQVRAVFVAFGAASVVGALLFLRPGWVRSAWLWQIGLNVFKAMILFQDFRLRMNQHYMLLFVTLVFLLLPGKRNLLRYTLVMFYVWASTLKLNAEWLTGAALYRVPWGVPESLLPAACAYVVVLEAGIVWGLLVANPFVYWSAFAQLCLFHLASWPVVGFFYPLLMLGLLSIFPLARFLGPESGSLLGDLVCGRARRSAYAFIGVFSALQLVPVLLPGDVVLTGEGRIFALHMFDGRVDCDGEIRLSFADGEEEVLPLPIPGQVRIRCDPVVSFSIARNLCHGFAEDGGVRLDLRLDARRALQSQMQPLLDIQDFCRQDLSYDLWRPNAWILRDAATSDGPIARRD